LVTTGWVLSLSRELNATGYVVSLVLLLSFCAWCAASNIGKPFKRPLVIRRLYNRFRRVTPAIFLIFLLAAFVGGSLYAPTNYDALCYRLPRILHWWREGHWHWIGGWNARMDFSSVGFEWLMAPILILFKTDRLLFLINVISYALLPGLIYSSFTGLGISRRVAWYWMWLIPCAYCFVLQAGSLGNDTTAAVYFLSSIAFSLRAVKRSSWYDAALALLAAALMTGAKVSNLPLLLPLLIVILPTWRLLFGQKLGTLIVLTICMGISFLPIAACNTLHSGDWSGDPYNLEKFKLSKPVAGIIGNTLLLGIGALTPPIVPNAKLLTAEATQMLDKEPLASLHRDYPRLEIGIGEIPTEESAGVGLGIALLIMASLIAGLFWKWTPIAVRAMLVGLLGWLAIIALMMKFGNHGIARLASPYYPVLILPILAMGSQKLLVRKCWWRLLAVACALSLLPALLLNPARPLIPVKTILASARACGLNGAVIQRGEKVYGVYGSRNDQLEEVRLHIPIRSKVIGFVGTGDESEYSFWKPLGGRNVTDLSPLDGKVPDLDDVDVIVGSEWGINDRYHTKADVLAARVDGKILWQGKIASMAGREPMIWYIIIPSSGRYFLKDKS
jgi:hypothetical protein